MLARQAVTSARGDSISSLFSFNSVRWRRKPRWLPVAKTKIFRVPEKPVPNAEETERMKPLYNQYRTTMKSLRIYFAEKTKQQTTGPEVIAEMERREEEHHLNCIQINEEWNKRVAELRKSRVAKEREVAIRKALEEVEQAKIIQERELEVFEAKVREEKDKSKTYITPHNIDEAIGVALDSFKDYNFSIDLDGNILRGRNTKPEKIATTVTKKA